MPGTTTGDYRTGPFSSSRRGPTTPWPIFPRNRSSAGPCSAASSTNTSEPHRNPGQDQWPNSGTPQILTDDNFSTIVKAVELGRGLYDNLARYVRFQIGGLFGYIITFLGAAIFNIAEASPCFRCRRCG